MILNRLEFLLVHSPVRRHVQMREVQQLRKMSDLPAGKTVLELGCGTGHGAALIVQYFKPKKMIASDLDNRMLEIAKMNSTEKSVSFRQADACKLPFKDSSFDAVFGMDFLHHIPNWKAAVKEIRRVLKPGGQLILEDLSLDTFEAFPVNFIAGLFNHPYKQMYHWDELIAYLKKQGFRISGTHSGCYDWLMKSYFVVAKRKGAP